MIQVWSDGACTGSGVHKGLGGWAYKIVSDIFEREECGGATNTTNNRMEMQAVIQALSKLLEVYHILPSGSKVLVWSDSQIIVETLKVDGTWKKKANLDKWEEIDELITTLVALGFDVDFVWVKAHNSKCAKEETENNKRVDKLATKARDLMKERNDAGELIFI